GWDRAPTTTSLPTPSAIPPLAARLGDAALLSRQETASKTQREAAAQLKNPKQPDLGQEPDVLFQPLLRRLINAHFRLGQPENAAALVNFAASSSAPEQARAEAISVLAEWAKPSGRDHVTGLWGALGKTGWSRGGRGVRP